MSKGGGNVKEVVKRNADGKSSSVERHQPSTEECGRGSIKEHENWDGPVCPKCGQVCKDKNGLRNHVLSHYYEIIFEVLHTFLHYYLIYFSLRSFGLNSPVTHLSFYVAFP